MSTDTQHRMTPARTIVFTIAAGLAVGNLYWAQPLIEVIADSFGVPTASAAALVTVTQIGYALGIFLIVPLGDIRNRRRLVPAILVLSAATLTAAALAPTYAVLLAALAGVGLTTVAAQILAPLASELAAPAERGRVVGTIASGALIGVLLSRTVAGLIADQLGWQAVYAIAAVVTLVFAVVLRALIPELEPRQPVAYPRLLGSVFTTVARHRAAGPTLLLAGLNFAVFSLFWTSLTFLLTAEPFAFSVSQIGLFGLAGLAGAVAARRAGALHDRGWSVPATGAALALLGLSLAAAWAGSGSVVALIIVVVVLDVAAQATLVLSQTRLFALAADARSRLNTAVVVSNFVGGAIGSALAGPLWAAGGWDAVMVAAIALTVLALVVWAGARRRLHVQPA